MPIIIRLLILLFPLMLTSCAYISAPDVIKNRDKQYLAAKSIPPLRIPPGLSSSAFENEYPVPDHNYPENAKYVSLVPPGLMDKTD